MALPFVVSAATHVGSFHADNGRNNQDAWCIARTADFIVAGVADGCGAGRHTEVGSSLGITFLVNNAAESLRTKGYINWGELLYEYNTFVSRSVNALLPRSEEQFDKLVTRFFLHTALITVLYEGYGGYAEFVRFGDGYVVVNGKVMFAPLAENNFPLVPADLIRHRELWPRIYQNYSCSLAEVSSLLLATDGFAGIVANQKKRLPGRTELIGGVRQLWIDPKYARNPGELERYLNRIGGTFPPQGSQAISEPGYLDDDTTMILALRTTE